MKYLSRIAIILLSCIIATCLCADAQNSKSLRKQRESAKKQLSTASKKLRQNEAQVMSRLNQLNLVESEIADQEQNIINARTRYDLYRAKADALNDSILQDTRQLDKIKQAYGSAVQHVRHNGSPRDKLMFIFAADDFNQALQRYRYLNQFSKWRESQSEVITTHRDAIARKKQRLDSAALHADAALQALNHSLQIMESKKKEQKQVIAKLQKDGSTLKSVIQTQEKKLRQLDKELEKLLRAEEARAKKEEKARSAKPSTDKPQPKTPAADSSTKHDMQELSGSFASNKGRLPMPVTGKASIVKHFGRQRHEQLKNVETNNGGIDIETAPDSKARAIFNGKVSGVFQTADFNNVVMVRHGEYLTIYVNIASVNVKSGQDVAPGDIIGSIYSDPNDDNRTILHFEIRKEIEKLDPEIWLKR